MSRALQSTPEAEEEFAWPGFNPSPGYCGFLERLRRARIDKGLSIADMSDEVGLTSQLAHEFETLAAPLPFEFMSVWCESVGVPFDDFLAIYWADEREWDEREWDERRAEQNAPALTATDATDATEISRESRHGGWLFSLRATFDRIASFFRSRFSTRSKNSK